MDVARNSLSDSIILASDLPARSVPLRCIGCRGPVVRHGGKKQRPHFRHKNGTANRECEFAAKMVANDLTAQVQHPAVDSVDVRPARSTVEIGGATWPHPESNGSSEVDDHRRSARLQWAIVPIVVLAALILILWRHTI